MARLPNFFILGAGRCGSTFLHEQLARHPDIFMSENKEPTFFCDFYGMMNPWEYLQQFAGASSERIVGESSHAYMTCPASASMLKAYVPDAKFLVTLRNPVDRAYSLYSWMTAAGLEWLAPFDAALAAEEARFEDLEFFRKNHQYFYNYMYYRSGLYGEQLRRYLDLFRRDQFLLVRFEDVVANTESVLRRISTFLEVDPDSATENLEVVNQSRHVRSARLQFLLRRKLQPFLIKLGVPNATKLINRAATWNAQVQGSAPLSSTTRARLARRFLSDLQEVEELTGFDTLSWRTAVVGDVKDAPHQ